MNPAPAFQFYAKDWIAEVRLFSLEQRGAYIDLLTQCWLDGSIPAETSQLAKLLGISTRQAARILPPVLQRFTLDSGTYRSEKLERYQSESTERSVRQSIKAEARWEKERMLRQCHGTTTAMPFLGDADEGAGSSVEKQKAACEELPAWLPPESWQEYVEHRQALRKKLSPLGAKKALAMLERLRADGNDPVAVIDQTIAGGWCGLFPLRSQGSSSRSAAPSKITNSSPITSQPERSEEEYQQQRMQRLADLRGVPVESFGTYAEFCAMLEAEDAAEEQAAELFQ